MTQQWPSWITRYNPNHVAPHYSTGGQFTSAGGTNSGTASTAPTRGTAPTSGTKAAKNAANKDVRNPGDGGDPRTAGQLRAQARALRAQARQLEKQVKALEAQRAFNKKQRAASNAAFHAWLTSPAANTPAAQAAAANAKIGVSTNATTGPGTTPAKATTTATIPARPDLASRIGTLKAEIKVLNDRAAALDRRAAGLI